MKKNIALLVVCIGVLAGCSGMKDVPAPKNEQTIKLEERLKKEEAARNEERIKNDAIKN